VKVKDTLRIVLEGRSAWGTIEVPNLADITRRGWGRYRLTVYPPGTNAAERRRLGFYRAWAGWGALAALLAEIVFADLRSPRALVAIAVVYLAGAVAGNVRSRRLRAELRQVSVIVTCLAGDTRTIGEPQLLRRSLTRLEELDEASHAGRLGPVQFEAGWAEVYNSLDEPVRRPFVARLRY
jgi:hypothetical protein